jgi:hypothetical protein
MVRFCITFALFLFLGTLSAQQNKDTLFLMNGKFYTGKVLDTLLGGVTIKDPKDTTKNFTVDNEDLFSVKYGDGREHFYYTQDTLIGNEFTRDEMRYFMIGERDAKKGFKAPGSFFGSMAAGFAGGLSGNLLGPVLPFGYLGLCGITKVRIRHETISNPYYVDHDAYILGYERQARARRRIQSLIGGGIGLVAGYTTNFIIARSNPNFTLKIKF